MQTYKRYRWNKRILLTDLNSEFFRLKNIFTLK
jgi:hypothetical protein